MSKFVAKFRKNRDYEDDYQFSQRKKRSNKHDSTKRLINYDYDKMFQEDEMYENTKYRKKSNHY